MLLVVFAVAALAAPFYRRHLAQYLNEQPHKLWQAGIPETLANYTYDEVLRLFLHSHYLKSEESQNESYEPLEITRELPANAPSRLDYRETYPNCFYPPEDQMFCSSCYAFATLGAFSARRCIAGLDKKAVPLSAQQLVSCDKKEAGCSGGQFLTTWEFLERTGAVTRECLPYKSGVLGTAGDCPTTCADGTPLEDAVRFKPVFALQIDNYTTIMESLINDGPVQTGFHVYEDFMYYVGGIYHKVYGSYLGGHAVVIVGYGEMDDIKYWIVRNSWGPKWGENGYFRIVRGDNECEIEKNVWEVKVK